MVNEGQNEEVLTGYMKVDVQISFPCAPEEWAYLCKIHSMFSGGIQVHVDRPESVEPFSDQMTDNEVRLLDAMSCATHQHGSTPLMDVLEVKTTPKRKGSKRSPTSVRALVEDFLASNGPSTIDQLLDHVASIKTDRRRNQLRNSIYMAGYQVGLTRKEGLWYPTEVQADI